MHQPYIYLQHLMDVIPLFLWIEYSILFFGFVTFSPIQCLNSFSCGNSNWCIVTNGRWGGAWFFIDWLFHIYSGVVCFYGTFLFGITTVLFKTPTTFEYNPRKKALVLFIICCLCTYLHSHVRLNLGKSLMLCCFTNWQGAN